jgi:hypothetical protein
MSSNAAEIAELRAQLDELNRKNQALDAQLAAAKAITEQERIAQAIAQVIQPQPKKKAKVPPPNTYDGNKDKLLVFRMQTENWLNFCEVNDDQEKIRLTIAYMKEGEAAEWVLQKAIDAQEAGDDEIWSSWSEFTNELSERFGDIDPVYTAREKLKKLRQGNSVEKLNTEFKKYMNQCEYGGSVLIEKYQDCLNNETLEKIYSRELPKTINEWMRNALQYERLAIRLKARKTGRTFIPNAPRNAQDGQSGPRVTSADYKPGTTGPMDIDAARRLGKCRHCAQDWTVGHSCEKKKAAQAAWQTRAGARRNEVRTEPPPPTRDWEAEVAMLKDQLAIMARRVEQEKDDGN